MHIKRVYKIKSQSRRMREMGTVIVVSTMYKIVLSYGRKEVDGERRRGDGKTQETKEAGRMPFLRE